MTDNIVSTISRFLTPELIGKMASATGLDRSIAQKATAAAVPAILSGLAGVAGKPGGARQLANAVAEQPTDLLETSPAGSADRHRWQTRAVAYCPRCSAVDVRPVGVDGWQVSRHRRRPHANPAGPAHAYHHGHSRP